MKIPAFLAALLLIAAPAAASPEAALDELLAQDRAFSAIAAERGLGAAMAAMLDESVVAPLPNASFARGRADALNAYARVLRSRTEWAPVRGGISADGRHGFTLGYTTTRAADGSVRPGKYLSYWIRRPEGWRVAAWRRAPRPAGEVSAAMLPPVLPSRPLIRRTRGAAESLAAAERAFAADAQRIGLGPAFARWGSDDSANMGQGPAFRIGATAIAADMPAEVPARLNWAPDEGVVVADSGDLGFTYGWIRAAGPVPAGQPAAFPYFTVWRRASAGAPWRYVAA